MTKVGVFEEATHALVDILEESEAKNKLKVKVIEKIEKEYCITDKEFIKMYEL